MTFEPGTDVCWVTDKSMTGTVVDLAEGLTSGQILGTQGGTHEPLWIIVDWHCGIRSKHPASDLEPL